MKGPTASGRPVTRNMRVALERTYAAMPDPKWVVAVGDCGCGCAETFELQPDPRGPFGWREP